MRASELRGVRWSDVDLEAGTIHVAQRADAWGNIGSPKSAAGTRDIPCTPLVLNTLRQWRLACPSGDLIFPSNSGRVASHPNFIKRVWEPLQVACGLTEGGQARYNFHCLRHAAASLFIETLQWSPKRIQTVMGHSSITMTYDRYGHMFERLMMVRPCVSWKRQSSRLSSNRNATWKPTVRRFQSYPTPFKLKVAGSNPAGVASPFAGFDFQALALFSSHAPTEWEYFRS